MSGEHWKKLETIMVDVDNTHVLDRIISPTEARIDARAESLSGPLGQIEPILVAQHLTSSWRVVAGATRLAAAGQLGWKQIEATVIEADNDFEYHLIEIVENLHRHDLSENERTKLKKKQDAVYAERLAHFEQLMKREGESRVPSTLKSHRATGGPVGRPKGGIRDASRKAGISKSAAQRHVQKVQGAILSHAKTVGQNRPPVMEERFNRATHLIGTVERFAEFCRDNNPFEVAGDVLPEEAAAVRVHIGEIDAWLNRFIANLTRPEEAARH